jgi:tetratricopeptide (TPR) repeat protein
MGQLERAMEDYEQAIAINPQLSDVYAHRGVTLGKMGNFRQSIASLTEGIRLSPKNPDSYFNRGMTYFQAADFEHAIADFSTVLELSANDESAYYWRGISNEQAGRQREAIADYKQFLTLSQDKDARREIEQRLSRWQEGKQRGERIQTALPEERQSADQAQTETPDRQLDLYDLIVALGERALRSTWFCSGVYCEGEKAPELYALADQNRAIEGRSLLPITAGIRQTIQGDFQAFDEDANTPWLFIRAWDGNGFYIETDDFKVRQRLQAHFQGMEEVEGAAPPYEGLFIPI